jgi:Smg protein
MIVTNNEAGNFMFFDVLIELLDSIEYGYFSQDNKQHWLRELKKFGVKDEDEANFLTLIEKIIQLKSLVCLAKPRGGFPMRIYNAEEQYLLSPACRGLLLHFEQAGVLPPELREVVIEQVMRMPELELNESRLRILILLVLFHQAGLDVILSHYQALPLMQGTVVH